VSRGKHSLLLLLAIFAIACGSASPAPAPAPGSGGSLSLAELKYRLIDKVGVPFVCGPPVARQGDDEEEAAAAFPTIKADTETYRAILAHIHPAGDERSSTYQVAVWREWQKLQAIRLLAGAAGYEFTVRTATATVTGTIDGTGKVTVTSTQPGRPNCPICLAAGDRIATPNGEVPLTELRPGMLVWTIDAGRRVAAPVSVVGHTPAPIGHRVIRVVLADGRAVLASPGHPTGDGRRVGELNPGDLLDGSRVKSTESMPYVGDTWDLLPLSSTGEYWADGVLLGSTLFTER